MDLDEWGSTLASNIRKLDHYIEIYHPWALKQDLDESKLLFEQLWPEDPAHPPKELICDAPPPKGAISQNRPVTLETRKINSNLSEKEPSEGQKAPISPVGNTIHDSELNRIGKVDLCLSRSLQPPSVS